MWIFALFLALPLVEIALFVTLGAAIGLWATLGVILATGLAGVAILRRPRPVRPAQPQGLPDALVLMADQSLVMLAGFCLVLPGFLTDAVGLLLLLPPLRKVLIAALGNRINFAGFPARASQHRSDVVIDGDYEEVVVERTPLQQPSKWSQD